MASSAHDISQIVSKLQMLASQLEESVTVQKELSNVGEGEIVYKLVGPVLLRQDHSEAYSHVEKRLDYIRSEIAKADAHLKESRSID